MGSTLVKVTFNRALLLVKGSLTSAVGPTQFSVEKKGALDQVQWALRMAMESNGMISATCIDAINAFGEIERDGIHAALLANPSMHLPIRLFEIIDEQGSGELWYYDENGDFVESCFSRSGVR